MARKSIIFVLAILMFSLLSGICFAADSENSINLGNEIMQSIDKTENSMKNVVSGNVIVSINDTPQNGNMVQDGVNSVGNGMNNMGNSVNNGINHMENGTNSRINDGTNYNTTRTTAEGTMADTTMTTTTWMWIILALAATIIFVAIWYYATQDNGQKNENGFLRKPFFYIIYIFILII